jgi:hypothetical protein
MTEYRELESFDLAEIDAVGVGESAVAIASGERIQLVSKTGRSEFEHDEPISDLALNDRIIVLSADQLTAYTPDGASIWTKTLEAPHAVTTLSGESLTGVLAPERLVTVDVETGQESSTVERRRPGQPRDDRLIGIEHAFVFATWSFLRCVDTATEEIFDRNLHTAIRDVGYCDGVLIAALQNGQLRAIDAETGQDRWETELSVRQIAPHGATELLLSTDDGIKSIDSQGSIEPVGSVGTGEIYASRDGSIVCSIRSDTAVTHVPSEDLIEIEILTESVGVGGTVDVQATNLGDTTHEVTLVAVLEHADLSPAQRHLELAPREPILADFPVESLRTEGETTCTVRIEDRTVAGRAITVSDAAESVIAVETDLWPTEVKNGVAELKLSVENTGKVPLDSVNTIDPDEGQTDIKPGETWTTLISKPYEPGRTITVGMEVVRENRRTELAPSCRLPNRPSIELQQRQDAVHGRIEADEEVGWADELVIDVPGANRVRSQIHIEDGSLLVVLPVYEDGIARIGLSSVGITAQAKMTDEGPLAGINSSPDRGTSRDSERRNLSERSRSGSEPLTQNEPQPDAERLPSQSSDYADDRGFDPTSRAERTSNQGSVDASDSVERTDERASVNPDEALSVERELSEQEITIGHAVGERITVRNEGEPASPVVVVGEDKLKPGKIAPDETWTSERIVVFFTDQDTVTHLPEVTLKRADRTVDRIPSEGVSVTDRGLVVRGTVDPTGDRYEVALENNSDSDYRIDGLKIDGQEMDVEASILPAGERTLLNGTIQQSFDRRAEIVNATVVATGRDQEMREIHTAAVVRETTEDSGENREDPFRREVSPSTQVVGEYGTVVLVFENVADERLSDVILEARGESINDMLYSRAHRETLPPHERIEHYVDLKTDSGTTEFDVTLTYTDMTGTEHSRTFRATGLAVETEEEWTDDHQTSWSLEAKGGTAADDSAIDIPSKVSTPFR